ncbi:MAG: hypothetical protein CL946_05180 [Ectothiorhodospiraceae bacterium]|nr:hypothetical protein [Ectothiorhodospiraceae bacterium]
MTKYQLSLLMSHIVEEASLYSLWEKMPLMFERGNFKELREIITEEVFDAMAVLRHLKNDKEYRLIIENSSLGAAFTSENVSQIISMLRTANDFSDVKRNSEAFTSYRVFIVAIQSFIQNYKLYQLAFYSRLETDDDSSLDLTIVDREEYVDIAPVSKVYDGISKMYKILVAFYEQGEEPLRISSIESGSSVNITFKGIGKPFEVLAQFIQNMLDRWSYRKEFKAIKTTEATAIIRKEFENIHGSSLPDGEKAAMINGLKTQLVELYNYNVYSSEFYYNIQRKGTTIPPSKSELFLPPTDSEESSDANSTV